MPVAPVEFRDRRFTRADLEHLPDDGRRSAVEVLSHSTKLIDLNVKKERLARAGTPAYWVVDPVVRPDEARLIAWQLAAGGEFRQVADVSGEAAFATTVPFPVRVVPADLVRWPRVT